MGNRGLLFIPDISGFTRFINETEIDHSRLVIQELLELLINANEIGLEVSEIEGDAILFYRFGDCSDMTEVYRQVEQMFCKFHHHLNAYDLTRFCQCKACVSAVNLSLKVITHYGEFTGYNVKNFHKLIGRDIIVAHQLLKNDITEHEYWLVTKQLLPGDPPKDLKQWMKWDSGSKQTESGEIGFHYTQLGELKKEIPRGTLPHLELSNKTKMLSVSKEYETDIITLFHAAGDFNYRARWREGVKRIEKANHFLPRVGMHSKFIMEHGEETIYSSGYSFNCDKIEFSETDDRRTYDICYSLEKTGGKRIRLTIDYYLGRNPLRQLLFGFGKRKSIEAELQRSLENLTDVVKEIKLPPVTDQ